MFIHTVYLKFFKKTTSLKINLVKSNTTADNTKCYSLDRTKSGMLQSDVSMRARSTALEQGQHFVRSENEGEITQSTYWQSYEAVEGKKMFFL